MNFKSSHLNRYLIFVCTLILLQFILSINFALTIKTSKHINKGQKKLYNQNGRNSDIYYDSSSTHRIRSKTMPPIYFKKEPNNYYVIDSLNDQPKIVVLDCLVGKNNINHKNEVNVKWFKDNIDLDLTAPIFTQDKNFKKEILSNNSLKLTYETIASSSTTNPSTFELLSTFKCIASDNFGKISSKTSKIYLLNVNQQQNNGNETSFLKQPENSTLIVGKRLLLRCKPNLTNYIRNLNERNINLIQYQWFKDDQPVVYNSKTNLYKDGSLEIVHVAENDAGFYKCIAKYRSLTYYSQPAFIKVNQNNTIITTKITKVNTNKPLPPKFLLWPEDRSVVEDDEVIFECLALNDGTFSMDSNTTSSDWLNPQFYKYKWLKDGVALDLKSNNRNKRIQLVQGVNLRIEKLNHTDAGTYTCRICNSNENENGFNSNDAVAYDYKNLGSSDLTHNERDECDERSSVLKVLVAPRFIKRPSNTNVTLKSDAELECSAFGIPAPTIQWFKNGEPIYPSDYFQFNPNQGNLKILGIISQDEGYYQCLASNELNTIQSIAQLTVLNDDFTSSINGAENSNIDEDDLADFNKIKVNKKLTKTTLSSWSSSSPTEASSSLSTTTSTLSSLISSTPPLIIHLSAPRDFHLVKSKSRSIILEWQQPSIIRNELNKATSFNSNLNYAVTWKAKNTDRKREMNTTDSSILIDELTPDTVYLVQVCAIIGHTRGPYANIEVKTEPEALLPGTPVDFKAEFVSNIQNDKVSTTNLMLMFKWKKPVINANNIGLYRLYFKHLHYGPVVSNKNNDSALYDENNELLNLNKEDDYQEDDVNGNNEEGNSQFEEKYIDIELPQSEQSDSSEHIYEFILQDLLKYSTYKFRLVAIDLTIEAKNKLKKNSTVDINMNSAEISGALDSAEDDSTDAQNGAELIVETPSDVPDGPPENLKIEILNTTAIMLQWDLPALEKRNGLIVGYKIAVKENDKQIWNSNEDSEPKHKIISGLLPAHKYSLRVIAKTINGSGPSSEWIIAETFSHEMDESRAPGQPLDLVADPTDKNIVIHWTPPSDSNKVLIRKYLLKYGIGYPDKEIELPGNRNSYIIDNLIPSSQYVLSLKAINNAGFGMEILKDVITKRKSALSENENLFPPLNVQAVAISSQTMEVRWTDWHLKQEESIPDDRIYTVRYNIADMSNAKYKYKNATERTLIISDLKPNTLYDFSVRLVIGRRESEWSMTTSQMTMETTPAPHDITIKTDPSSPTNVILSWLAPSYPINTGFVILYLDEATFKEKSNHKWRTEHVQLNNQLKQVEKQRQFHTIRKLKLETVYYFKIQSRNNRAYGASSPTIIFKTPNAKGEGGGKIFMPNEFQQKSDQIGSSSGSDPLLVLNSNIEYNSSKSKSFYEMNMIWIIVATIGALFIIIFLLFTVFMCKRSSAASNNRSPNKKTRKDVMASSSLIRNGNSNTNQRNKKFPQMNEQFDNVLSNSQDNNNDEDDETESSYLKSNNNHMLNNPNSKNDLLIQAQLHNGSSSQSHHISCSNSSSSTLIKQVLNHQQTRTPNHLLTHNNQALIINNPNHIMMTSYQNNNNSANTTSINDVEFYSNMTSQQFTNNSNANSEHFSNNNNNITYSTNDSCFPSSNNNNNYFYNNQQQNCNQNMRTSSFNEEGFSPNAVDMLDMVNNEFANTSAALAAANAAFNAPILSNGLIQTANNINNDPSFLRHTIRPKPIAIPISNNLNNNSNGLMDQQSLFSITSSTSNQRKSFKNLPIATATLISSNNQQQNQNQLNFNDLKQSNKLHYTAKPYIIDNQVQMNGDYSMTSNHSPALSSHSSGQQQVYDKIGNIISNNTNNSSKSLLQPLKSFGNNHVSSSNNNQILSSLSIPNTPAKYCDGLNGSNFSNINMLKSPAKKQLLVSLGQGQSTTTTTASSNTNISKGYSLTNKSGDILMMMAKSNDNIYDKNLSAHSNNEELTVEMANLEGIMKDLNAITAQQFEC